jgi:hypothetical protein
MINDLSRNPLFFLRYFSPKPSRASRTPHSHSIVLSDGNALIFQRKFFLPTVKARPPVRQIFSLLISKGNSRDSKFARVRQLSLSIDQFVVSDGKRTAN